MSSHISKIITNGIGNILFLFCLLISNNIIFPNTISDSLITFTSSNLPIVVINTNGQIIPGDHKITADMGIIYNGEGIRNYITDPFNNYEGKIGIELRGSTSLNYPKKQYGFETRDSAGNNNNVSLLGFPPENDWILNAPYADKSLIRNALVYKLANETGRYASRSKFCELVLNGEYMGVYILFEKIKRDANRVNIKKLEPPDTTGDALTGGYIIKIDKTDGENIGGWFSNYLPFSQSDKKIFYQYHYPEADEIVNQQKQYIQNYILNFETRMKGTNIADTSNGYPVYIDTESFVDYLLINEVCRNIDAYRLSMFMHKDRQSRNGKLVMGPVWDYNLAFGNVNYYLGYQIYGWDIEYITNFYNLAGWENFYPPFWWKILFEETNFRNKIYTRWQELKNSTYSINNIYSIIDSLVVLLDEAQTRNFERWPILGVYIDPNYYVGQSYQDEINYLKNWIAARIVWLDQNMVGNPSNIHVTSDYIPDNFKLYQNFPNPFNPVTLINYDIEKHSYVVLKVYDILGNEVVTLVDYYTDPGSYKITFNASELSAGVYLYRLQTENFTATKKMLLLK
jgi:hypothetical protein